MHYVVNNDPIMSEVFIAWGNIQQIYPFHLQPPCHYSEIKFQQPALSEQKQRQRQVAYFLLWQLLKQIGDERVFIQGITRGENGRPCLLNQTFDFNLSHSGDWVAVILTKRRQHQSVVAIDLEHPKKQRNLARLLAYYATEEELKWWQECQHPEPAFYLSWCAREAILKAKGRGIGAISKVMFEPTQQRFSTSDAPAGTLLFTSTLPFYLACYVEDYREEHCYCYQWDNHKLAQVITKFNRYLVVNREQA